MKIFTGILTVVTLFSLLLLVFTVPAIEGHIFAIETRAARTILDKVHALAHQGGRNLAVFRENEREQQRQLLVAELREKLRQTKIGETGYIYIFDSTYNMLIHPNPNIEQTNFATLEAPGTGQFIGRQLAAADGKKEGWSYYWDHPEDPGSYIYPKISWVRHEPELDWYIAASVYVEELRHSAMALKKKIFLSALAVLLAATIGACFLSLRITRPLRELDGLAARVRQGDFSVRAVATEQAATTVTHDEIGELGRAFNQMLDHIEDNIKLLDARVAERTADLRQALDELRELEQLKSTFLANISHEMRTPLTSIHGFAELTRKKFEQRIKPLITAEHGQGDRIARQISGNLEVISREAEQLTGMIDDALDLVAMEAGRSRLNYQSLDPLPLIRQAAADIKPRLADRGLALELKLPPALPPIRADRKQLVRVLDNLLDNAVKFTEQGRISINATVEEKPGHLTIEVSDTGIGIAPTDQATIFDKFKQLGDTLVAKPRGSGLGGDFLVEDQQGRILLSSEQQPDPLGCQRHPVRVGAATAGAVLGTAAAAPLAGLLALLGEQELERRALATETLNKYKESTLLYNLAQRLSTCLDLGEIAWLITDETQRFIKGDQVTIKLLNEQQNRLEELGCNQEDPASAPDELPRDSFEKLVLASGQGEIVNDPANDPRFPAWSAIGSLLCAPLKIKDRAIGTLTVSDQNRRMYTAEHLQLLNTIAAQTAAAVENARLYEELKETFFATVQTLAETIEKRDPYTAGHTRRVMEYSLAMAEEMNLEADAKTTLRLAAILHDIGKIGVRDHVLLKTAKLTEEEFSAIKMHTIYGEEILNHVPRMAEVIAGVRQHHERYDGRGYPDGLEGEEIDFNARIIAVADTFDAMTSDRPYRKGLSRETAFAELRNCAGSQFDPKAVLAFFQARQNGRLEKH